MANAVLVQPDPERPGALQIKPAGFLGQTWFPVYRQVLRDAGARFNWTVKCYELAVDRLPALVAALERAGLEPALTPDVAGKLQREAAAIRADLSAGEALVASIDVELSTRNLHLFQHQREGIGWLAPRRRALLADAMGLGKSAQSLLAAPRTAPLAIVCPANVKLNWVRECRLWRPDLRPRVLRGRGGWAWPLPGEVVIANYEILPALDDRVTAEGYGPPKPQTLVIVDEAHYCKGGMKVARARRMRAVADMVLEHDGRIYLLTGTPLTNRPPELWNVLKVARLAEDAFGTYPQFRELMGGVEGSYGIEWQHDRIDPSVLARLRQVSLYRRREDVMDLPGKMRVPVEVPGEFPPSVRKLLDGLLSVFDAQGIRLDVAAELVDLTRITGAAFEQLSAARAALATAKIPAMVELIQEYEEAAEPVVVFSWHRAPIDLLGARAGWGIITGDTRDVERQTLIDRFQAGDLKGLGLTIQAGGIGITLTRAAHEIFVDLAWTPAANNQAEDRCLRIGQTRSVLIKRLVADHEVDRRVEAILGRKQALIDAAVEPSAVLNANRAAAPLVAHAAQLEATMAKATTIGVPRAPVATPPPAAPRPSAPPVPLPKVAEPKTPVQAWIVESLLHLAGLDPDGAVERNDVGFNQADSVFGHSLAMQIRDRGGLSAKQYQVAQRMLAKYHRQVGTCPGKDSA